MHNDHTSDRPPGMPNAPCAKAPREAGFTLIEAVIALAVAALALLGFSSSLISTMMLGQSNRESALARRAAHEILSELQTAPFGEIFARYNSVTSDDIPGETNRPGAFAVAGIALLEDDADGFAGEIVFPDTLVSGGLQLREDYSAATFGQAWDLDLNGEIDADDHAADYQVLPVLIRVEWRGKGGPSKIELRTTLIDF